MYTYTHMYVLCTHNTYIYRYTYIYAYIHVCMNTYIQSTPTPLFHKLRTMRNAFKQPKKPRFLKMGLDSSGLGRYVSIVFFFSWSKQRGVHSLSSLEDQMTR